MNGNLHPNDLAPSLVVPTCGKLPASFLEQISTLAYGYHLDETCNFDSFLYYLFPYDDTQVGIGFVSYRARSIRVFQRVDTNESFVLFAPFCGVLFLGEGETIKLNVISSFEVLDSIKTFVVSLLVMPMISNIFVQYTISYSY